MTSKLAAAAVAVLLLLPNVASAQPPAAPPAGARFPVVVPGGAAPGQYVEVLPGVYTWIRGNDCGCRALRIARWIDSLRGDRRAVYESDGFPVFRHLEDSLGEVTEYWTYPDRHLTYVFEGDRLIRTQPA